MKGNESDLYCIKFMDKNGRNNSKDFSPMGPLVLFGELANKMRFSSLHKYMLLQPKRNGEEEMKTYKNRNKMKY